MAEENAHQSFQSDWNRLVCDSFSISCSMERSQQLGRLLDSWKEKINAGVRERRRRRIRERNQSWQSKLTLSNLKSMYESMTWSTSRDKREDGGLNKGETEASVLSIKHTRLQLHRRCCRGNNTRVKREQAWCKHTHTHAALWLALSIIDQPWGQHTWRRGRRRETRVFLAVSSTFTFRCVHHVDYLCSPSTSDLWPLTSSLSAAC